eukprot:Gb_34260 [translate_table: standard]
MQALQAQWNRDKAYFEEQLEQKEKKGLKRAEAQIGSLEQKLQKQEAELNQWESECKGRFKEILKSLESAEKEMRMEAMVDEQMRVKLRDSQRFTKILQIHLKNEKKRYACLEEEIRAHKGRLDAAEETIREMVGTEEELQAKIKELEEWAPKLEYAYLENDERTFVKLYEAADPEKKNLLAKMFLAGAIVPEDRTFPINMVMESVHIRAFMSTLQNEKWRGDQLRQYQMLQRNSAYDIQRNPGQGPEMGENVQAFLEMHELYLKDFRGAEGYLQKLKGSLVEWQTQKRQLWDQSVTPVEQRIKQLKHDAYLVERESWNPDVYSNARHRVDALANKVRAVGSRWIGLMYFLSSIF